MAPRILPASTIPTSQHGTNSFYSAFFPLGPPASLVLLISPCTIPRQRKWRQWTECKNSEVLFDPRQKQQIIDLRWSQNSDSPSELLKLSLEDLQSWVYLFSDSDLTISHSLVTDLVPNLWNPNHPWPLTHPNLQKLTVKLSRTAKYPQLGALSQSTSQVPAKCRRFSISFDTCRKPCVKQWRIVCTKYQTHAPWVPGYLSQLVWCSGSPSTNHVCDCSSIRPHRILLPCKTSCISSNCNPTP